MTPRCAVAAGRGIVLGGSLTNNRVKWFAKSNRHDPDIFGNLYHLAMDYSWLRRIFMVVPQLFPTRAGDFPGIRGSPEFIPTFQDLQNLIRVPVRFTWLEQEGKATWTGWSDILRRLLPYSRYSWLGSDMAMFCSNMLKLLVAKAELFCLLTLLRGVVDRSCLLMVLSSLPVWIVVQIDCCYPVMFSPSCPSSVVKDPLIPIYFHFVCMVWYCFNFNCFRPSSYFW